MCPLPRTLVSRGLARVAVKRGGGGDDAEPSMEVEVSCGRRRTCSEVKEAGWHHGSRGGGGGKSDIMGSQYARVRSMRPATGTMYGQPNRALLSLGLVRDCGHRQSGRAGKRVKKGGRRQER